MMLGMKHINRKISIVVFICAGLVLLTSLPAIATSQTSEKPGEIIVKYKDSVGLGQMAILGLSHGTVNLETVGDLKIQEVKITDGSSVGEKLTELKKDPEVEYAEPNYRRQAQITTPNDAYYSGYQWNMPIIRANYAWDITRGSNSTVIAIIDTGVSLTHPDLSSKIVAGYDFVDNDSSAMDEQGHGTHVAGIAAAITNNGVGVAGVNWNARIMPVRVLDENGSGWDSDIAEGIIWATDNGADVINMSLGGPTSYPYTMQSAVDYAYSHGVVVVAAVGNNPNGIPIYPAACSHVIGVAATNSSDQRASFSNYGTFVDIAAPGETIASTYWSAGSNVYALASGTSMATPHVAGLAALVLSQYPSRTPDQIEACIESSADDLGAIGRDNYYGYGRINAYKAVNSIDDARVDHLHVSTPGSQIAGLPFAITITAKNVNDTTVADFNGQVSVTDTSGTISPTLSGYFIGGIWTDNMTVTKTGTTAITATLIGQLASGSSSVFTVNSGTLNHIHVTPPSLALNVGGIRTFTAEGQDQYNNVISGLTFNWIAIGGTVNPASGTSTTYAAGLTEGSTFNITASSNGVNGSARIIIYGLGAGITNGLGDDVGVYRYGSYPNWFAKLSTGTDLGGEARQLSWGNAGGDTPIVGDFDGNTKDDIGIYRYGSYPNWFFDLSIDDGSGFGKSVNAVSWGNPGGDTPIVGDFNGDTNDDIGIYRYGAYPNWFILLADPSQPNGFRPANETWAISWGNPGGDTPIVGDFDGDGKDDIGVYRYGSYPNWFTKVSGSNDIRTGLTWAISWGNPGGDTPIVGDFDGDGKDDIGIYRYGSYPNWFVKASNTGDICTGPTWSLSWGNPGGDTPIIGDFDGS